MKNKKILVTGANGFVGKNLCAALLEEKEKETADYEILKFDIENTPMELERHLGKADFIFHLAGVNRPERAEQYWPGNVELTQTIVDLLKKKKKNTPIVYTSSSQAVLDNPYGLSKKRAEEILTGYGIKTGARVYLYRLTNIFGKWSRPNYNSVVATFCYNISRGLDITISDPDYPIILVYIDDVIRSFKEKLSLADSGCGAVFCTAAPTFQATPRELADKLYFFRDIRKNSIIPDLADRFTRYLYAAYLSFLDENDFAYNLELKEDERGALAEILKSAHFGQVFVSTTKPGVTRGHHYHNTKVEKFCVIRGSALVEFRDVTRDKVISYPLSGEQLKVIDIPPGYTHSITNVGSGELITLFWAGEIFNPEKPDTYFLEVQNEKR